MAGRPTDYSEELTTEICNRLVSQSMRRICMAPDMPSEQTVYTWLGKYPEFLEKYRVARELQSHCMADIGAHMGLHPADIHDPQAASVQLNAIKWATSKLACKLYGDKLDMSLGGQKDAPLTIVLKQYPAPSD
jgi:hypothetical protein